MLVYGDGHSCTDMIAQPFALFQCTGGKYMDLEIVDIWMQKEIKFS